MFYSPIFLKMKVQFVLHQFETTHPIHLKIISGLLVNIELLNPWGTELFMSIASFRVCPKTYADVRKMNLFQFYCFKYKLIYNRKLPETSKHKGQGQIILLLQHQHLEIFQLLWAAQSILQTQKLNHQWGSSLPAKQLFLKQNRAWIKYKAAQKHERLNNFLGLIQENLKSCLNMLGD